MAQNNKEIAQTLWNQARLLARRKENLYRIRAYRRAAEAVARLPRPVEELLAHGGKRALKAMPGIGPHLAESIACFAKTGEWKTYDELRSHRRQPRS
jgi:DNA polymerase (family 10)